MWGIIKNSFWTTKFCRKTSVPRRVRSKFSFFSLQTTCFTDFYFLLRYITLHYVAIVSIYCFADKFGASLMHMVILQSGTELLTIVLDFIIIVIVIDFGGGRRVGWWGVV